MKKYLVALVVLCAFTITGMAWGSQDIQPPTHAKPPITCTFKKFHSFTGDVWSFSHWNRKAPKASIIDAYHHWLSCAFPGNRHIMKLLWHKDKKAFYKYRAQRLFRIRITPFKCGSAGWWATPCDIPLHESGYGSGGGNLYGLLDAWSVNGCTQFAPSAWDATKRQQDICAHRHYVRYGRGGWPSY